MRVRTNMSPTACCLAIALALTVLAGCSDSDTAAPEDGSPPPGEAGGQVSLLFSISAEGGTFEATEAGGYYMTLIGVDEHTIAFADRPSRDAAVIGTSELIASWDSAFADDAPNAVLVEHDPGGDANSTVVVPTHPEYDEAAGTLTFAVTVTTGESPGRLAALVDTPHGQVPSTFQEASLFIDAELIDTEPANSDYFSPDDRKGFNDSTQE